jgi:hypothetical protein
MANLPRESQTEEFAELTGSEIERTVNPLDDTPGSRASMSGWKQQLSQLRQKTRRAIERLSEQLQRRKPAEIDSSVPDEVDQQLTATLKTIALRQDSLEAMLYATVGAENDPPPAARRDETSEIPPGWAIQLQAVIADQLAGFESAMKSFCDRVETRLLNDPDGFGGLNSDEETFIQSDMLPTAPAAAEFPAEDDSLSVMLGPTLCGSPELRPSIQWLKQNVLSGNPQALALVGQLLVFRCATPERKPSLLKDVGEAYYRCFPKTRDVSHPFEDAIVAWSRQICDEAGLPNWVEPVHPGERFDAARHSPVERGGVEVASVLGWVVLRDGGRVYSKALVQTR